ncbi:MAG: hypothetical protein WCP06_03455 [Verrucomicrobiota bacterium]
MIEQQGEGPGWGETEKETMTQPQEEFIQDEARPSTDMSDVCCARCAKPRAEWEGNGVARNHQWFCSPECADLESS